MPANFFSHFQFLGVCFHPYHPLRLASKTLEDVMSVCGVEPIAASHLIQLGWTVQSFACSALDLESFDQLWLDFFPDEEPTLIQKACLRAAYKMCQELTNPVGATRLLLVLQHQFESMSSTSTWAESFPLKVDSAVIDQLKSKFLANYPSELVNHDTMPSTRLLSLAHHQLLKKQHTVLDSMEVSAYIGKG